MTYGSQGGGWTYAGLKRAASGKVMPVADHAPHAGPVVLVKGGGKSG